MSKDSKKKMILIDSDIQNCKIMACVDGDSQLIDIACHSDKVVQLKNNIYLGKVTRVEPSLQAAFVCYDEDKYGFIPFHDIHPDYYQIPTIDKAKIEEKMKELSNQSELNSEGVNESEVHELKHEIYKNYQIQEVIKRNQPLLVQVNKDERGNKNVSLTTYITISGRHIIFMPNNIKNIFISKKITDRQEREKIKKFFSSIKLRPEFCLIVRTSVRSATEKEVIDDYNYVLKLWNQITEKTVKSSIPSLIYKDDDVIEYKMKGYLNDETETIVISGDDEYFKKISDFCLEVSNKKFNVIRHNDDIPLFKKYKIDRQIDELLGDRVNLKSGGYLVINHTEALTSIDVNSGKATAEKNIEETALKINLEAAEEVAKQVRLRNIGGLIVIDFIDMLKLENKKTVERRFAELILEDKAKTQVSRISNFGLMEISRQRLGTNLRDILGNICHHCNGSGYLKSKVLILNMIVNGIIENQKLFEGKEILLKCSSEIKSYIKHNHESKLQELKKTVKFTKILIEEKIYYSIDRFSVYVKSKEGEDDVKIFSNVYQIIDDLINIRNLKDKNKNKSPEINPNPKSEHIKIALKILLYPVLLVHKIFKSLKNTNKSKANREIKNKKYIKNYNVKRNRSKK